MAKTQQQIEEERKQRLAERKQILLEYPEVYKRSFDKALKKYLQRRFPEVKDDPVDPFIKESFLTSRPKEAQELCLKYNLAEVWDPYGDKEPVPFEYPAARYIRCQDYPIRATQMNLDSIKDLPPEKTTGRYLLVEIDLQKPWREIKADVKMVVEEWRHILEISGNHWEFKKPPEPRQRSFSSGYKKMEVWGMVEKERNHPEENEKEILWRLAKIKTFETAEPNDRVKWQKEERRHYDALKTAFFRDKVIYFGR